MDKDPYLADLLKICLDDMRSRLNPVLGVPATHTEAGDFHAPREAVSYARCLLDAEGEHAAAAAKLAIRQALTTQERQQGNIHHGNFKWMSEDQGITDLNSVQFVMENLIPLYQDYAQLLDADLRRDILDSVRLAMDETQRLDVSVAYTNIVLLSIMNSILGGEVLGDPASESWGRRKLDAWIEWTNKSGTVSEYNSPNYAAVDIIALAELAERTHTPEVAIKARLMEERLWLHVATHYHHPSAQIAGPHNRAYHNDVTGGMGAVKNLLNVYLHDDRLLRLSPYFAFRQTKAFPRALRPMHLPDYLLHLLTEKTFPYEVRETANVDSGIDLTTYMTASYALGSCSTDVHIQSDRFIMYYARQAEPGYGVIYARYIVNDQTLGSVFHASARSTMTNLYDDGNFWSLQDRNKAIVIHALKPQTVNVRSLKSEIIMPGVAGRASVLLNGQPAGALPLRLQPLDCLCIADEDVYAGIRPLAPTNLGREAPIILEQRGNELVLSIYNYYQGEEKRFWEYSSLSGHFYKGNIKAGFVFEAGDREQYGSLEQFAAHLSRTRITDAIDGNIRRVTYASDGDFLEIAVDLFANKLVDRRINGYVLEPGMLDCPSAVEGPPGEVPGVRGEGPAWLVRDTGQSCSVLVKPTDRVERLMWLVGRANVWSPAFGFGKIVCRGKADDTAAIVEVTAVTQYAPLKIECLQKPQVIWNGRDVTAHLVPVGRSRPDGDWRYWALPVL